MRPKSEIYNPKRDDKHRRKQVNFSLFCFPQALSLLDPKTINMFYFTGPKQTTPNCPIEMAPDFNPSGSASYIPGGKYCEQNSRYNRPFFTTRPGPKYEEWTNFAHEGRPGHHTQVSDGKR